MHVLEIETQIFIISEQVLELNDLSSRLIDSSFTGKHCTLLMHLITRELSLLLICLDKNNRNYSIIFLLHIKSPYFLMGRKQYNSGNIMLNH